MRSIFSSSSAVSIFTVWLVPKLLAEMGKKGRACGEELATGRTSQGNREACEDLIVECEFDGVVMGQEIRAGCDAGVSR